MNRYPDVRDEASTLKAVARGASIARYGDGEYKLCGGRDIKSQPQEARLAQRLRGILVKSGDCLVGIANINSPTPKANFWNGHTDARQFMVKREYWSSFISRPDSAPWIDTPQYWELMRGLWRGKAVTLVRGSTKSLTAEMLVEQGAGPVTEIVGPTYDAWAKYDELMERVGTPPIAILCLGPTATVMAVDLCAKGVHAIDLGHCGMFLKRRPMGTA